MITHNTSAVIVFQSTDYDNFTMINGNRGLNLAKINRIVKEIEGGNDMLQYYPIQVKVTGGKMEILDGQHRFFICQKLDRPVHYILIAEKKTMSDIARVNSNVEKWTPKNFIDCYISQGKKNYLKLQEFIDLYGFTTTVALRLLSDGTPGAEGSNSLLMDAFQKGGFVVNKWDEAVTVAEDAKKFSAFQFWTDRAFIIAIYRIKSAGLVSIDDLAAAFNKAPDRLQKNHTFKNYVYALEQIFNLNKQKRVVIV